MKDKFEAIKDYYPDGKIRCEWKIVNNLFHGMQQTWNNNGCIYMIWVDKDASHGPYIELEY